VLSLPRDQRTLDQRRKGQVVEIIENAGTISPLGEGVLNQADREVLHKKYLAERDKRLRPDGAGQYIPLEAESKFMHDPFTPRADREAVTRSVQVLLIGGGFAGIITGALLRKKGVNGLAVVELGGDFGGTWYWNRYPGARCDIESYIYMPMLEELGYVPSEAYARTTEIWQYARNLARHFGLYESALFHTRAVDIRWDELAEHWTVITDRGDRITARYVVLGSGQMLSRPKLPGVPGIERFQGHSFHTSRWDYEYTGGSTLGGLHKLRDKRVAIIGTGATAIQAAPYLAEDAKHLYVIQRTPSIIDVRGNRPTDPAWAEALTRGWQIDRMRNFDLVLEGRSPDRGLVHDQWSVIWGRPSLEGLSEADRARVMEDYDYAQMERIRRRIDEIVDDPATAESLKPYYSRFCKRPCFNDEYLQTFNLPNVTLVDTDGRGLDRITENAVCYGDQSYEVDCIIYATGFEATAKTPSQSGQYTVTGREDTTLDEEWGGLAFHSLHGISLSKFPNLFILGSSRMSAASFNIPHRLFVQSDHVTTVIAELARAGIVSAEPSAVAEQKWEEVVTSASGGSKDIAVQMQECTPSYYNNEGKSDGRIPVIAAGFAGGTEQFRILLEQWRRERFRDDLVGHKQ
jgi:cyclohexanone monooxygenase